MESLIEISGFTSLPRFLGWSRLYCTWSFPGKRKSGGRKNRDDGGKTSVSSSVVGRQRCILSFRTCPLTLMKTERQKNRWRTATRSGEWERFGVKKIDRLPLSTVIILYNTFKTRENSNSPLSITGSRNLHPVGITEWTSVISRQLSLWRTGVSDFNLFRCLEKGPRRPCEWKPRTGLFFKFMGLRPYDTPSGLVSFSGTHPQARLHGSVQESTVTRGWPSPEVENRLPGLQYVVWVLILLK